LVKVKYLLQGVDWGITTKLWFDLLGKIIGKKGSEDSSRLEGVFIA
jgi:hypothetical protein